MAARSAAPPPPPGGLCSWATVWWSDGCTIRRAAPAAPSRRPTTLRPTGRARIRTAGAPRGVPRPGRTCPPPRATPSNPERPRATPSDGLEGGLRHPAAGRFRPSCTPQGRVLTSALALTPRECQSRASRARMFPRGTRPRPAPERPALTTSPTLPSGATARHRGDVSPTPTRRHAMPARPLHLDVVAEGHGTARIAQATRCSTRTHHTPTVNRQAAGDPAAATTQGRARWLLPPMSRSSPSRTGCS